MLAARGLRVNSTASHYKAFYALQKLGDESLRRHAIRFDEMRATRHESIYEPEEDEGEMAARLQEALATLADVLPLMRTWLATERRRLVGTLAPLAP